MESTTLTHHWSMDVPECPLLAVQDLPLCLVLFPVNSVKRGNLPLIYQVKLNTPCFRIKDAQSSKHTHTHCRTHANITERGAKSWRTWILTCLLTTPAESCLLPLVKQRSYITDIYNSGLALFTPRWKKVYCWPCRLQFYKTAVTCRLHFSEHFSVDRKWKSCPHWQTETTSAVPTHASRWK